MSRAVARDVVERTLRSVDEAHRHSGVARALIEHVRERAAELGSGGVSWVTSADNEEAQRLYDELATRTSWVTYEMGT